MKMEKHWGLIFGIVSGLLLLKTHLIHGAELRDILSNFHPYITVQETYTDNLNLTPRNKEYDFITNISGGLNFSTADKTYGIDLSLPIGYVFYAKHNKDNFFSIGPAGLSAWHTLAQGLTFRVRDYLARSDEAREQTYAANALPGQFLLSTVQGQRAIYFRNVFEPSVEYKFGRENLFSFNYRNTIYENQSRLFEDSRENFASPKLVYWFDIRNGISLEYDFTLGNFERSPDFLRHETRVRYTYRFDPKASIFGEYSYSTQDFKSPGVDYDVHNPSLGIDYKFSPTLSGTAQAGYFWQIQDQGSRTSGLSFNVGLTKTAEKTTYALSFQGGYTEDYFTAQNLGFSKYYRAYGTINHQLTQRMTLMLFSSFEWAKHSGEKDQIWNIGANSSYQILKWLSASLAFSHRENHSSIDLRDYSEYRGTLGITATF